MSWTLSDIRSKFRDLTGRSTTGEISNDDVDVLINDYYRYDFCLDLGLDRFDQSWTQEMTATDSGEYSIDADVIELEAPIMANDERLNVGYDKRWFWSLYPSEEGFITSPTLAIGVSSTAAVKNSAFKFLVGSWTYSNASEETALSGSAVPQSKYGAWQLEVDSDGDVTIQAASGNATGYTTAARAINGLPGCGANRIVMGFVTAINTSGVFTPGTTNLDDSGVTATFTDGDPTLRNIPQTVLVNRSEGKIYIRPKCNDTYLLKSIASLQRPTALSGDTSTPHDEAWGRALALGAAIKFLFDKEGDDARLRELDIALEHELSMARRKQLTQMRDRPVERAY